MLNSSNAVKSSGKKSFRLFGFLEDSRDMNLVNMILNIEANNSNNYKKPLDVYDTYANMKELNVSNDFRDSIKNSSECVKVPVVTNYYLTKLKENDPNSFLVLPLLGKGHLWSMLIRKSDEGFNVHVVNKGLRFWHDPVEEFVFKLESQRKLVDVIKYAGSFKMHNIENVYRKFISNSDAQYNLSVNASPQKVGNCFTKNIQAGIKLAYATKDLNPNKMRTLRLKTEYTPFGTKNENRTTFKWDMETQDMQKLFVGKITDRNPHIKEKVEQSLKVYTANKHFRHYLKQGQSPIDSFLKAFDPLNKTKNLSSSDRIKTLMRDLTPYTFGANRKEIDKVVDSTGDNHYKKVYSELIRYTQISKDSMSNLYFQFFMEANHDTVKSLDAIYNKSGQYNHLPQKERTKLFIEKLNPVMLWLHKKKVSEAISFVYGKENVEKEYERIFELSKVAMVENPKQMPSKEMMNEINTNFPIIQGQVNHRISEYYYNVADTLLNDQKQPKEALKFINKANIFEVSYDNICTKGLCFFALEDYKSAVNEFSKAIKMDPTQPTAYLHRGKTYEKLNNKLAAKMDFEKAKENSIPSPSIKKTSNIKLSV